MGLVATETGSKREPVPAGTHLASCFGLVDLGTQTDTLQGKTSSKHKVWLWWELSEEKREDGQPMTIGSFYTVSLNEKATLRKTLESWRGRPFTEEELKGFSLPNVVGKPCMVTIMHEPRQGGGVRDKITAVTSIPKGMRGASPTTQIVVLDLDDGKFNRPVFDGLPNFLKEMIAKSPEGRAALGLTGPAPTSNGQHAGSDGGNDSDIPF